MLLHRTTVRNDNNIYQDITEDAVLTGSDKFPDSSPSLPLGWSSNIPSSDCNTREEHRHSGMEIGPYKFAKQTYLDGLN